MMYNKRVESCFFTPHHVGVLDTQQPRTVHHREGELRFGNLIDFYLLCDAKGTILKARFKAYGNPFLLAASEWLCQQLEGSPIAEHPCIDYERLINEFAIPETHHSAALQIEEGYQKLVLMMQRKLNGENK